MREKSTKDQSEWNQQNQNNLGSIVSYQNSVRLNKNSNILGGDSDIFKNK